MKSYELLEHTADFCLKVKADTFAGLFEAAAECLLNNIFNEIELCENTEKISFSLRAESKEEALIKFLNELLYMFYVRKRLLKAGFCYIKFETDTLAVEADFVKVKKFAANFEIKAVTYGNIKIEQKDNLFETMVIADV